MVRPSTSGSALPPGAMLGRYELLGMLSVGGMAEIYLARTAGLAGFEKLLVVKRMLPHLAQQKHYIDMFLAEARLGAMLDHPNVVAVNDIGEDTGNYYYAMEYVRGPDLRRIMKAAVQDYGRLPISNAVAIGIGLCAGLDHAHGLSDHQGNPLGVVHRDVSLSNVLVSYDGTVKVTDFGVAKSASSDSRTKAGTLKGKIGYMSPEQCRGDVVDRRSDLFAAGIILYELTTGRRLFRPRQSEFEVLQRIVREDAEPPSVQEPDYPLPLEEIVMRALRRDRDERYQSAREMQRDLETLAQTSRLATTAFSLGEYVRALVPPPPLALEALAPRPRVPTRVPTPPPEDPWEVDDDPPPLTSTPVAAMTSGTATPSRARPWGKTGLAVIAMVLIGVGAAVVTRGREPVPEEPRVDPEPHRRAARVAVEAPVRASVPEPATDPAPDPVPLPVPVPVPDPDPVSESVTATADRAPPRPAPAPARRTSDRDHDRDRDRHRRPSTPSRTAPATTAVDAGPSLFDDPLPPPEPAPTLVPDDPPAPAETPKPKQPRPKAEEPVPAKPKVVVTKADPGSFDATPSLASVEVDGPLGDSEIRRAVKRVLPAFRACYQAAAKDAGKTPGARAKLKFSIDETRAAQDVRATGSSLPGLNACLEGAAARIKTRIAPDVGDARVTVSVAFSPTDP